MNIPQVPCSVRPECEQLSIVVQAERGRAVCQVAAVFEPVHHGNREAADSTVHGDLGSHGDSDVVRALDDLQPSGNPCKTDGHLDARGINTAAKSVNV